MPSQTTPEDETSPLLGVQRSESNHTPVANGDTPEADNKRAEWVNLVWILMALWSAVFLGALDGTLPHRLVMRDRTQLHSHHNRDDCRNVTLSDRCILQSIESIVLHRHCILAIGVLLHAIIRETIGYSGT